MLLLLRVFCASLWHGSDFNDSINCLESYRFAASVQSIAGANLFLLAVTYIAHELKVANDVALLNVHFPVSLNPHTRFDRHARGFRQVECDVAAQCYQTALAITGGDQLHVDIAAA